MFISGSGRLLANGRLLTFLFLEIGFTLPSAPGLRKGEDAQKGGGEVVF